ncbi:MAG TPA: thioredoxin domain-containing protein [Polyangiaceae bacterium]|nr:thioredoxin domain-containing protein [Polyangiaceae bacterium]
MALVSALNLIRAAAVVALASSGALFVDYTGTDPAYCTAGTGCAAIRHSGWGYVPVANTGIAVPVIGAIAFTLLLAVTLLPSETWRHRLSTAGGFVAAVIGVALIAIQAQVIGAFCSLCLITDGAAIVAGAGAILLLKQRGGGEPLETWAWALLGAVAFGSTWLWPKVRPLPDVPAAVKQHYQAGKINVVEFADFECPFCRRLHDTLKKLNKEYAGRVHFVRLNMPLLSHPNARDAARAYVCADEQGKGEPFGDLLFEEELFSHSAQREAAAKLGVDAARFEACLRAPETDKRIDREAKILRDTGFEGLPTTFIGAKKIVGAQAEEYFRAAYEHEARGLGNSGIPWFVYVFVSLGVAGGVVWFGRRARSASA